MNWFYVLFAILCIVFFSISWILPWILSWLFERKYNIFLRIGRIGFPYLKLCDIQLSKNGFSVHIDEIGIKSSFLNSELTKLVTLVVKDVRINRDINLRSADNFEQSTDETKNALDFRGKKIPSFINTFAQFMAVHVYNVSAMLLRSETPGCLIHSTAKELHLDGSILKNAKSLLVTLNLMDAETKILRHAETDEKETKLAEFSFAISMETTLVAQGPLSVEKLDVKMSHTSAVITGGFYSLTQNRKTKNDDSAEVKSKFSLSELKKRFFPSQIMSIYKKEDSRKQIAYENVNKTTGQSIEKKHCDKFDGGFIQRLSPIIPKNCSFLIDDTSLKGVTENGKIEYNSSLKSMALNYKFVISDDKNSDNIKSHVVCKFCMVDLQMENSKEKLVEMKSVNVDAKLKNSVLNVYLQLSSLLVTYNHEVIHKWLYKHFFKYQQQNESSRKPSENESSITIYVIEKFFKTISVNFCAEIANVLAIVKLKDQNSSIGFSKVRLMLDQALEEFEEEIITVTNSSKFSSCGSQWQAELLLEALFWTLGAGCTETTGTATKVMHMWGTPLYLGKGLFKMCSDFSNSTKIYSLLDTVQLEWSLELSDYILLAIKCFKQYSFKRKSKKDEKSLVKPKHTNFDLSLVVSHSNIFLQSQNTEYFVARLDSITVDKKLDLLEVKFQELKVFTLHNTGDCYICIRAEDISNYKVFIKTAHLEVLKNGDTKICTLKLLDNIITFWSTNLHMKGLLLYRDLHEFVTSIKSELGTRNKSSLSSENRIDNLNIFGKFEFHITISKDHSANITLDELTYSRNLRTRERKLLSALLAISIDGSDIFSFGGLTLHKIIDNKDLEQVKAERFESGFELPLNPNTWSVSIDVFKAIFPYEHNYAEAVQNQFVSVWKWLKIIHNLKKDPDAVSSELPSDLIINVKEFLFEMSDDPFEVKLRDNTELLEDEYHESLKRQKMLKDKIAELCKTHLHLPAAKVEELYATLRKKNAEIYVQRSRLLYKSAPPRTRLFAWTMNGLELLILADPTISGRAEAERAIRAMDPDSPWPGGAPAHFSTLWCRAVALRVAELRFQLRDFPQPLLRIRAMSMCGQLAGAEQVAPPRAIRTVEVHLGDPFPPAQIQRSMLPLKFYHDLNCEMEAYSYAFGPCWEPVVAQCNLSFNRISAPSRDPSPPLPFWDRARLLFHGRLTVEVQRMQLLLHASLDPYNTTEEMAITWEGVAMDWTNARFIFKGDLNIFVRTASKYDDVQLLKLPNLKLVLGIQWVCLGDPNDHHSVIPCAPDKVPEYSSNQVHDSFRAFRSQNINLSITLETKPSSQLPTACPILLLYGSTLRWIESLKLILSGVTRPTRRGAVFKNFRPRKVQLSRHYKKMNLLIGLHKFQVWYWMSFAMQRGCELYGGRLSSSSEHSLSLVAIEDGLKHRPKAEWSIVYMNSELNDSEIWLKSALQGDSDIETSCIGQPVEKCYCLSVAKVSYGRETVLPNQSITGESNKDIPTHRLVVYDLRGAWTKSNRNVAFALFDTFMNNKRMKENLSTEAMKSFRKDSGTTPMKRRNTDASANSTPQNPGSIQTTPSGNSIDDGPAEPRTRTGSNAAASLLQRLVAEAADKPVVYSDDLTGAAARQPQLQGLRACASQDDVLHTNWHICLVNAQVLLKGIETRGYVIISAAKAEITQRAHRPAWRDSSTLVSKTTWVGMLECMQYYATVTAASTGADAGDAAANENIMWLTVDNIQEKGSAEMISEPSEVPNLVGSGVSVGAVVSDTVGPTASRQLQRIVSRCRCEFFYAGYGDVGIEGVAEGVAPPPPPPPEDAGACPFDTEAPAAADAFTLMHHDLEVCTNSLQYGMVLDIVNNLLLHADDTSRKQRLERRARMRFQLQLGGEEAAAWPQRLHERQTQLRDQLQRLRRLERDSYLLRRTRDEQGANATPAVTREYEQQAQRLDRVIHECKALIGQLAEELDIMVSCWRERRLVEEAAGAGARRLTATSPTTTSPSVVRANEICFKHARWRLTEADGQIGIADLLLSNFLYTKNSKSDDSVEHLLELGYLRMSNLLPNEIYKEVICPTEIQYDMPIEHKKVLRIFCRERPPVGGISVKEHFEINLVPLTIGLTKKFYNTMMKFSFPERDADTTDYSDRASEDGEAEPSQKSKKNKVGRKSKERENRDSNFYLSIDNIDDVEKMKKRAEKNKLFVYIKIPAVPVRVSYKGSKGKNLEDLRDVSLVIPTLEYHNMTWTWLDLLLAVRSDSRRVILSQAIKQKLQLKRTVCPGTANEESHRPMEDDKARMLLGATRNAPENRSGRKGVGGVFKFGNRH